MLLLMDGQKSLWDAGQRAFPTANTVEILDLLHATPRIWDAAHLFYGRDEEQALRFVYDRVLRLLKGEVRSVVAGLRQMGTKRKLRGKKRAQLAKMCSYLDHNAHRMRYDVYLAAGYPIASGVIEGACRHFIKDRMERSGMRWTMRREPNICTAIASWSNRLKLLRRESCRSRHEAIEGGRSHLLQELDCSQ